ncbi:MAG: Ig domain-containing protein [Oscillospiraceae bacterium]|nr:Ig domain-containing protein [Oscillospiraceae bacterium]
MKRILSVILAVMMLVSILPTAFAETKDCNYVFTIGALGKSAQIAHAVQIGEALETEGHYYSSYNNSNKWVLVGRRSGYGGFTRANWMDVSTGSNATLPAASNESFVMKINVPESGIYSPRVYSEKLATGMKLKLYIAEADTSIFNPATASYNTNGTYDKSVALATTVTNLKNAGDKYVLGEIDTYASSVTDGDHPLNSKYLEAGDYWLVFEMSGTNPNVTTPGQFTVRLKSLSLTETPATGIVLDKETVTLDIEGESELSAVVSGAGGTLTAAKVIYESSAPSVVAVDAETGKITALSAGNATITAKVAGYPSVTDKVSVKVNAADVPGDYDYNFNFTPLGAASQFGFKGYTTYAAHGEYAESFDLTKSSGKWAFVGRQQSYSGMIREAASNISTTIAALKNSIYNEGFALKIYVPEAAKYSVTFNWLTASNGMGAKLWLVDASTPGYTAEDLSDVTVGNDTKNGNISAAIANAKDEWYLGEIDTNGPNGGTRDRHVTYENVSLKQGDYILLIKMNVTDSLTAPTQASNEGHLWFKSLNLDETGEYEAPAPADSENETVSFSAIASTGDLDAIEGIESVINGEASRGDTVTLTAKNIDDYRFIGWKRGSAANGKFITGAPQENFEFTILTNTCLTAVYEPISPDSATVEFWNENGEFLEAKPLDESFVIPAKPALLLTGFEFDDWYVADGVKLSDEIDSLKLINAVHRAVAKYNDSEETFTVTASVGTMAEPFFEKTDCVYDELVPLKQDEAGTWLRNGKVVAYGKEYNHRVWGNSEISYISGTAGKRPVAYLEYSELHDACMVEYDAAGKPIIEAGILFSSSGTPTVDGAMQKFTSQRSTSRGQFTAKPTVDIYTVARGYIVYDNNGTYEVAYSDVINMAQ